MHSAERPRQDPVSCESCRKRKQKCNREQPCSNCKNRGALCNYSSRRVSTIVASHAATPSDVSNLRAENAAIKARLEKLEHIILSGGSQMDTDSRIRPSKVRRIAQSDVTIPTPSSTVSSSDPELARNYRSDVEWLDSIGTGENARLPQLSADFDIRVASLGQITEHTSTGQQERCILLPHRSQAIQLFDAYVEQIDPMQHVIHIPSVRRAIEDLYKRMQAGDRIEPNETVLFLSIIASIAFYWDPSESTVTFSNSQSPYNVANYWLKTTLDVLEHVKRTTSATLETVQACLILVFLIYHLESFSPKVRAILAGALSAAKDLGLHKTDSNWNPPQQSSTLNVVEKEMRRRVWWHIAGTDWSLTLAGGAHEGSYNVNPKHMKVKVPRNVSDEELETRPSEFEHRIDEPSIMSYFLQRIRLSEMSRDIADLTCSGDVDDITVEDALEVESRFEAFLAELPFFLRVDEESRKRAHDIEKLHPHIILQRYTVNFMLHARRCKFHLPLLLRGSYEPEYAFSRKACLDSARAVLKCKTDLTDNEKLWMSNSKLGGFLHLYFYATVVLVMDLCINKTTGHEAASKEEIQEAVQTLEDANQHSVAARMFLHSLQAALRKHKIRLKGQQLGEQNCDTPIPTSIQTEEYTTLRTDDLDHRFTGWNAQSVQDSSFDELWQSYIDSGMKFDPIHWDPLFTDLEACVQRFGEW